MGANAVYASSFTSWVFYVGAAVEMFTTGTGIAVRSIASNVVAADEVGKLNALLGLVESLEPTLYAPLYLAVWDATRDSFTVAFLLMSIALVSPALVIFSWVMEHVCFKHTTTLLLISRFLPSDGCIGLIEIWVKRMMKRKLMKRRPNWHSRPQLCRKKLHWIQRALICKKNNVRTMNWML